MIWRSTQGPRGLMTCVLAACAVAILPAGSGAGEKRADDPVGSWKLKFVSADGKAASRSSRSSGKGRHSGGITPPTP